MRGRKSHTKTPKTDTIPTPPRQASQGGPQRATRSEPTSSGLPVGIFFQPLMCLGFLPSSSLKYNSCSPALPLPSLVHITLLPGSTYRPPPQVKPRQRDPGGSSSYWRNKPFQQMCVITKMGPAGKAEVFITHLACSPAPRHPHSAALLLSKELGTCPPEDPRPALLCPLLLPPGLTLICPPLPFSQHTSYV